MSTGRAIVHPALCWPGRAMVGKWSVSGYVSPPRPLRRGLGGCLTYGVAYGPRPTCPPADRWGSRCAHARLAAQHHAEAWEPLAAPRKGRIVGYLNRCASVNPARG